MFLQVKCLKYWPNKDGMAKKYSGITIETLSEEFFTDLVIRKFRLRMVSFYLVCESQYIMSNFSVNLVSLFKCHIPAKIFSSSSSVPSLPRYGGMNDLHNSELIFYEYYIFSLLLNIKLNSYLWNNNFKLFFYFVHLIRNM